MARESAPGVPSVWSSTTLWPRARKRGRGQVARVTAAAGPGVHRQEDAFGHGLSLPRQAAGRTFGHAPSRRRPAGSKNVRRALSAASLGYGTPDYRSNGLGEDDGNLS